MELMDVICVAACTLGAGSFAMSCALWHRTQILMKDILNVVKNPQKAKRDLLQSERYKNI
jgi:hypothetical protein